MSLYQQSMRKRKETIILILALLLDEDEDGKNKRKWWVAPHIKKYGLSSMYETVYQELRTNDPDRFRTTMRMTVNCFDMLLDKVREDIEKMDTHLRNAIRPDKRLALTLRYLATGESFVSLGLQFCIGDKTVGDIVMETCSSIVRVLSSYLQLPQTPEEWMKISDKFYDRWDYPNCVGALDGNHIMIEPPPKSGAYYFNFKGHNSIVLMALVGPSKEIVYANVGMNGRVSDGGIWNNCDLKESLNTNQINLPEAKPMPGTNTPINYHIVSDSAFPLGTRIMKPFSQKDVSNNIPNRIFNYRLSRARIVSENCFGILVKRFEIYRAPIRLEPDKAVIIVYATLSIHNWLLDMNSKGHTFGYDEDDACFQNVFQPINDDEEEEEDEVPTDATKMRELLKQYFSGVGARHWQMTKI